MIFTVDASSLEWRTINELSKDPVGIEEILNKADVHTNNQIAFNLPSRLISKKYLFRTIYNRGKGYAFTVDPDFMSVSTSVNYWDEVGNKFYTKYAGINQCHLNWQQEALHTGKITSPFGLFWPIPFYGDKIPWTLLTNYPNQGTGAEVMKFARVMLYRRIKERKHLQDAKFISTVHDSIDLDTLSKHKNELVKICHEVFRDIPQQFKKVYNYDWVVPLDCECKAGPNFKDQTPIPFQL